MKELKDETDVLQPECRALVFVQHMDFGRAHPNPALIGDIEPSYQMEQGALARPAPSQDCQDLVLRYLEIDFAQGQDVPLAIVKAARYPFKLNHLVFQGAMLQGIGIVW